MGYIDECDHWVNTTEKEGEAKPMCFGTKGAENCESWKAHVSICRWRKECKAYRGKVELDRLC